MRFHLLHLLFRKPAIVSVAMQVQSDVDSTPGAEYFQLSSRPFRRPTPYDLREGIPASATTTLATNTAYPREGIPASATKPATVKRQPPLKGKGGEDSTRRRGSGFPVKRLGQWLPQQRRGIGLLGRSLGQWLPHLRRGIGLLDGFSGQWLPHLPRGIGLPDGLIGAWLPHINCPLIQIARVLTVAFLMLTFTRASLRGLCVAMV